MSKCEDYKLTAKEAADITRKEYGDVSLDLEAIMGRIKMSAQNGKCFVFYDPWYISETKMIIIKNELEKLGYDVCIKGSRHLRGITGYCFSISWGAEL